MLVVDDSDGGPPSRIRVYESANSKVEESLDCFSERGRRLLNVIAEHAQQYAIAAAVVLAVVGLVFARLRHLLKEWR